MRTRRGGRPASLDHIVQDLQRGHGGGEGGQHRLQLTARATCPTGSDQQRQSGTQRAAPDLCRQESSRAAPPSSASSGSHVRISRRPPPAMADRPPTSRRSVAAGCRPAGGGRAWTARRRGRQGRRRGGRRGRRAWSHPSRGDTSVGPEQGTTAILARRVPKRMWRTTHVSPRE